MFFLNERQIWNWVTNLDAFGLLYIIDLLLQLLCGGQSRVVAVLPSLTAVACFAHNSTLFSTNSCNKKVEKLSIFYNPKLPQNSFHFFRIFILNWFYLVSFSTVHSQHVSTLVLYAFFHSQMVFTWSWWKVKNYILRSYIRITNWLAVKRQWTTLTFESN